MRGFKDLDGVALLGGALLGAVGMLLFGLLLYAVTSVGGAGLHDHYEVERIQSVDEDHWCWSITSVDDNGDTVLSKIACEVDLGVGAGGAG